MRGATKLVWWNVETGKLEPEMNNSQLYKALKFIEHGLVQKQVCDFVMYFVLPIEGYNKTTYRVLVDEGGDWRCNCQYAAKGKQCSHILACKIKEGIISANRGLATGAEDV